MRQGVSVDVSSASVSACVRLRPIVADLSGLRSLTFGSDRERIVCIDSCNYVCTVGLYRQTFCV